MLGALATTTISRASFDTYRSSNDFGRYPAGNASPQEATAIVAQTSLEMLGHSRLSRSKLLLGVALSSALGFDSSFLGIGAGFIYVPVFVYLPGFRVNTATATSLFILAAMAFTGSTTHVLGRMFHPGVHRTAALAIGTISVLN